MSMRRTRTTVTVSHDRGVFMISVAAELAEMHPQTLRMYEQRGLIEPKRSPKGTRLYSHEDVDRLRRIQEMTNDLGLNLAGVEHVLRLEQIDAVKREMRGGELVPLKHTRDLLPRRMPPAEPEPSRPRRIPIRRDGEQPAR
jgi:MerR family transcriptional regulator/heat shock protein HspR